MGNNSKCRNLICSRHACVCIFTGLVAFSSVDSGTNYLRKYSEDMWNIAMCYLNLSDAAFNSLTLQGDSADRFYSSDCSAAY